MNYLSPLSIPEAKIGNWAIVHKKELPNTKFDTANLRCQMLGGQKNKQVSWPHETIWHKLQESGGTWMSDIPCEHAQTIACLKGMKGNVLVGGLGLGLAATILARRKSVKSVTVVELQPEVIQLVEPYLSPKTKLKIVQADLMEFLKEKNYNVWDYSFYDIWCSDGEGTFHETVCPLYDLSNGKVIHKPVNWNEDVMRGQLFGNIKNRFVYLTPQAKELWPDFVKQMKPPWEHDGTDRPWHNWSVPYWQWWKERQPEENTAYWMANLYAQIYGLWSWRELWANAIK